MRSGRRLDLAGSGPDVAHSVSGRISAILLEVAGEPGLTLTDVARRTRLPVSTTHRLLGHLVEGRVLDRADGTYSVRPRLRDIVSPRERAAGVRFQVSQVLEDLWTATRLRARFGVWSDPGVSYLECSTAGGACRSTSGLFGLPGHATALGKAILAHAPPAVVRAVIASGLPSYTPHTIVTEWQLQQALAAVRRTGVAVSRKELRDDECAIAVPVFGPNRLVVGALELAIGDLSAARSARPALVVAAGGLSRRLAADPGGLPTGNGSTPLQWAADPTSVALSWSEPEVTG